MASVKERRPGNCVRAMLYVRVHVCRHLITGQLLIKGCEITSSKQSKNLKNLDLIWYHSMVYWVRGYCS